MSSYKTDKAASAKTISHLDERIENLVKTKEDFEKKESLSKLKNPVTKEDLEKLNFAEDLTKLKEIHREKLLEDLSTLLNDKIKELEEKDQVLSDLNTALNEKVTQLEVSNQKLKQEKNHSDALNKELKTALKKLSDAELHLQVERDWLAEQVEKKSLEVIRTIEQLIKAENAKS